MFFHAGTSLMLIIRRMISIWQRIWHVHRTPAIRARLEWKAEILTTRPHGMGVCCRVVSYFNIYAKIVWFRLYSAVFWAFEAYEVGRSYFCLRNMNDAARNVRVWDWWASHVSLSRKDWSWQILNNSDPPLLRLNTMKVYQRYKTTYKEAIWRKMLCSVCQSIEFHTTDYFGDAEPKTTKNGPFFYPHRPSLNHLESSAQQGCYFCV